MRKRILSITLEKVGIGYYENNGIEFTVIWKSESGYSCGTERHILPLDVAPDKSRYNSLNDLYDEILRNCYE
jgi:hypothetical protein